MKLNDYLKTEHDHIYVGAYVGQTLNLLPEQDLHDVDLDYEVISTEREDDLIEDGVCTILVIEAKDYQYLIADLNDRDRKAEILKAIEERRMYDWLCNNYHRLKGNEMLDILKEYVYYVESNMFDTESLVEWLTDVL